jgi:hypothetical protein
MMKKPAIGKICIVAILALGLVYVPMSRQSVMAGAPQNSYEKTSAVSLRQHKMKASTDRGVFTIHREGNQSVCKAATPEEMQEFKNSDTNMPLQVLNPRSEIVTNAVDGLTLTLRGTAQLDANAQAKAAYIRAAEIWMSIVKSPITAIIDVDFGTTFFGRAYESGVLGATGPQIIGSETIYPVVRAGLRGGASNTQQLTIANATPAASVPTTTETTAEINAPAIVFRALGIIDPIADPDNEDLGSAPRIGFNSAFDYDFDQSNGIDSDKIDFTGIALHEIGHALGFSSEVGFKEQQPTSSIGLSTWDLFRFRPGVTLASSPTAQRVIASGGSQVFFIGGQEVQLSTGRPAPPHGGDGNQASHWKDDQITGNYIGLMDPSARDGQLLSITQNDLDALESFGHTLAPVTPLSGDTFALTSEVPQFSAMAAPSGNSCLLNGLQFAIVVPAGTTQLKIDLNGIQDTDMYVRFNQRIGIQGSGPVADFAAESELGSETIIITPSTSPALQIGTYFIGIGNCGPAASPFNITATASIGGTSPVVLRSASFDAAAPVMVVKATGLFSPAELEVNGVIVTPPLKVKVKSEAKAKIVATAAELGLHAGANTIRLRINGLFTNSVTVNQ